MPEYENLQKEVKSRRTQTYNIDLTKIKIEGWFKRLNLEEYFEYL